MVDVRTHDTGRLNERPRRVKGRHQVTAEISCRLIGVDVTASDRTRGQDCVFAKAGCRGKRPVAFYPGRLPGEHVNRG